MWTKGGLHSPEWGPAGHKSGHICARAIGARRRGQRGSSPTSGTLKTQHCATSGQHLCAMIPALFLIQKLIAIYGFKDLIK